MIGYSIIGFSLLFHIMRFALIKLGVSKRIVHAIVSSLIGAIHAIITVFWSYLIYRNLRDIYDSDRLYIESDNEQILPPMRFTYSYMIYDLIWLVYYRNCTYALLFHHLNTIFAFVSTTVYPYGRYVIFMTLFNEISTPFYNFNTIFSILNEEKVIRIPGFLKMTNQIIFAITFFVFRIVLIFGLIYNIIFELIFVHPTNYNMYETLFIYLLTIMYIGHYLLNLFWFRIICTKMMRYVKIDKNNNLIVE